MRALVCPEIGAIDRVALGHLEEPVAGPGQVVISVENAAVNFADLLVLQDLYQFKSAPPFAPGMEGVGIVSEVGPGVSGFELGDRIAAVGYSGAFAERWAVEVTNAVRVPDDVASDIAAAMTIAYGTSYHALEQRAGLQPGETLLVLGAAGGVGSAAVELGAAMGARVIAAASNDDKLAFTEEIGADATVNYSTEDLRVRVKELTGGAGVDVVFDPVGGSLSEPAFRSLGWKGRHLVIGFAAGDIPAIPMNLALLKGASLVGVFWGAFTAHEPEANRRNAAELFEMYRTGAIAPRIDARLSLDDAAEGLRMVAERRVRGRVIITV